METKWTSPPADRKRAYYRFIPRVVSTDWHFLVLHTQISNFLVHESKEHQMLLSRWRTTSSSTWQLRLSTRAAGEHSIMPSQTQGSGPSATLSLSLSCQWFNCCWTNPIAALQSLLRFRISSFCCKIFSLVQTITCKHANMQICKHANMQTCRRHHVDRDNSTLFRCTGSRNFKTARLEVFKRQRVGCHFDHNLLQFSAPGLYFSRFDTITLNILWTFLIFRERWWFVAMSNCQSTRGLKFRFIDLILKNTQWQL